MKTKLLLFVMLAAFTLSSVKAQTNADMPFKIGIGGMIGLPVGDYSDFADLAFGFDLLGEYAVAPSFALTLSAGYVDWVKKSGFSGNAGLIPILAGAKYYFSDMLYGSIQAGISIGTDSDSESAFTFAPSLGYKLSDSFDLSLKYQSATKNSSDASFLGLRLGYTF